MGKSLKDSTKRNGGNNMSLRRSRNDDWDGYIIEKEKPKMTETNKYNISFYEEPSECQKCDSYDITSDNEQDDNSSVVTCNDCNFEWSVVYTFKRWIPME